MNTHPLVQVPEEHHSPCAISSNPAGIDEKQARLLEVRSEAGTVYVCPSKWQRLRLLWTFRHFHVLPQQILSRRDQHLIEKLSRSAVITPVLPVPRSAVLGVIERPRTRTTGSAPQVVTMRTDRRSPQTSRANLAIPGLPDPGHHQRLFFDRPGLMMKPANRGTQIVPEVRFRQWGAVGVLTVVCLVVILTKFLVGSLPARTVQISKPPSAPLTQTAIRALPPAVPLPVIEKPKHRPALPSPLAATLGRAGQPLMGPSEPALFKDILPAVLTKPVLVASPVAAPRPFVAELPQGHFAAPIAANPNQVGELHLRALIAADGSVKDVSVVGGDPKLAAAGMRAVRRWHYNPYEASATQAERETLINMKFFGQDAVSVSSVAR